MDIRVCETNADYKQSHPPSNQPSAFDKYPSCSMTKEVGEEQPHSSDFGGQFTSGKGKNVDGESLNEKISGRGIFFSKYFPGESLDVTHLHWKKVISGRNVKPKHTPQTGSSFPSFTVDETSALLQSDPQSSHATSAARCVNLSKCHTITREDRTNHPVCRDNNGSGPVFKNCHSTMMDHKTGRVSQGPDESRSWERLNEEQSTRDRTHCGRTNSCASSGFIPVAAIVGKSTTSDCGPHLLQDDALTSTSLDHHQPQGPCPNRPAAVSVSSRGSKVHRRTSRTISDTAVSVTDLSDSVVETGHSITEAQNSRTSELDSGLCQVCEDMAAGFYCGAFVCEACKKFFIRASKQEKQKFVCLRESMCKITKESRVQCQYCRYQKCLKLRMHYPGEGKRSVSSIHVSGIPCRVCGSPSSGFHFGALTCEGCKGFFRRMVKEREPGEYKCSSGGNCEISMHTRNMCKACRYKKCISNGMSVEGSRIGRQPNAVKHAISLEVKKQRLVQPLDQRGDLAAGENNGLVQKEESKMVDRVGQGPSERALYLPAGTEGTAPPEGLTGAAMEVKEDPEPSDSEPSVTLTNVVLTEVNPGVVVKQEPEACELMSEEELTSGFLIAGKELSNMCAVSRAKSQTLDKSEFVSYAVMWKKQMKHFNFHAQCCIRFSKKVPGFKDIVLDDKVALVQNAIYPIVVLNHSRNYELETGFYNFFNFNKLEEELILSMCPEYTTLQSHFRHMGIMAQAMHMTDMEFTLLSSLLLCDTDCPGLTCPAQVARVQSCIMGYLQNYETNTHPDGPGRFGSLLLRISEMRLASEQHIQTISGFLSHHPELEVPQMFKEMFF